MRWLALLALVVVIGAGRSGHPPIGTKTTSGFSIRATGDTHYRNPQGDGELGALRLSKFVTESNLISDLNSVVICGDFQYNYVASLGPRADSLTWLMRDSLLAPVLPVVGNHENARNALDAYLTTGDTYNPFTDSWPEFYEPWSGSQRGRRWYGRRLYHEGQPTNVCVFSINSNAAHVATDGDTSYTENNPAGGYAGEGDLGDFDGVRDADSAQRRDLRGFLDNVVQEDDWFILMSHRALGSALCPDSTGPSARDDLIGADISGGALFDCDSILTQNFLVLVGDIHETKLLVPDESHGYYTMAADWGKSRERVRDRMAEHADRIQWFAVEDSVYSANAWSALVDSLGATWVETQFDEKGFFLDLEFISGSDIDLGLYLIQNGAATTKVDSLRLTK